MANGVSYFPTMESFEEALEATSRYRSERIVVKHLENLDQTSLRNIRNIANQMLDE